MVQKKHEMSRVKHKRKLLLDHPGLVLYDDLHLKNFIDKHNIKDENLLEYFTENNELGSKVLLDGVIIPLYSIEPTFYDVYISINEDSQVKKSDVLFSCKDFPFKVISGKIELTTIIAIVFWDNDNFQEHDAPNDLGDAFCIEIPKGNYTVDINGFYNSSTETKGYEFVFKNVKELPLYKNQLENQDFSITK